MMSYPNHSHSDPSHTYHSSPQPQQQTPAQQQQPQQNAIPTFNPSPNTAEQTAHSQAHAFSQTNAFNNNHPPSSALPPPSFSNNSMVPDGSLPPEPSPPYGQHQQQQQQTYSPLPTQQAQRQEQRQDQRPEQQQEHGHQGGGGEPQFDIFEWYPKYQSCQRYFINHAQHSTQVQAVGAFINILLPCQRSPPPASAFPASHTNNQSPSPSSRNFLPQSARQHAPSAPISLIPYLRRLTITGLDFPGVLHGFFGDDWSAGIGPLHEQERRNYLFAAKSGGWESVKREYDMGGFETVPFMRPLQGVEIKEIEAAEKSWSEWLAMEDWMLGERCPAGLRGVGAGSRHRPEDRVQQGEQLAGMGEMREGERQHAETFGGVMSGGMSMSDWR